MPPDTSKIAPTPSASGSAAPDKSNTAGLLARLTPGFDATLAHYPHLVLAVSGGADSVALLHLVSAWAAKRGPTPALSVVTVDHALRDGSAGDAAFAASEAARLGLPHQTLVWAGDKPTTGVQAAARQARFDLIRAHLGANQWPAVVMAHTADDQAETVLMRLARGSGVDGLAAMRPTVDIGAGLTLIRPLLGVTKNDLAAFLRANGHTWREDPSNQSARFERVRLRRARAALANEGCDLDSHALARTAMRMARAHAALTAATAAAWAARGAHAGVDPLGYATLDWTWLLTHPEEIRLRLLGGLLNAIGGQADAMSLGQLERLTIGRDWQPLAGTLHGVALQPTPNSLVLTREWGRQPLPEIEVGVGELVVWDRRFRLTMGQPHPAPVQAGALGPAGLDALRSAKFPLPPVPARVLWALPALRSLSHHHAAVPNRTVHSRGDILEVPALGYHHHGPLSRGSTPTTCAFIGPAFASSPPSSASAGVAAGAMEREF